MSSGVAMGGVHGGIVDTLIGLPTDHAVLYETMRRQMLRDAGSQEMVMPAQYMFKDIPLADLADDADPVAVTLAEMDRFGISTGLISLGASREHAERALREHPERFVAALTMDPNRGMDGIRDLVAAHEQWDVRAVSLMPHGVMPQARDRRAADVPDLCQVRRAAACRCSSRSGSPDRASRRWCSTSSCSTR